jgi:hypothetical protein
MARPQHRKSQSTSALSIIASSPAQPSRVAREKGRGGLERVEESSLSTSKRHNHTRRGSADRPAYESGPASAVTRGARDEKRWTKTESPEDIRHWVNEVRLPLLPCWLSADGQILAMRASVSRRMAALRRLESCLLRSCINEREGVDLATFLDLNGELERSQLYIGADRCSTYKPDHPLDATYTAFDLLGTLTFLLARNGRGSDRTRPRAHNPVWASSRVVSSQCDVQGRMCRRMDARGENSRCS